MARTADHEQRRAQIIAGVRAVAGESGLGRVTIARTAEAAGVSVGLVQHYYASKEDLLADAFAAVRSDVLIRIDAEIARSESRGARIETMLCDGLSQLLPIGARRRAEVYLSHAFAGLALEDETLRGQLRDARRQLQDRVSTALTNGVTCGEVDADTDPGQAAFGLLALTDGLASHLLVQPGSQPRAWSASVLRARVAEVCPGECSHQLAAR
ncbi:TetR/AcrR family transcriptional regulator [Williamsia sp.]|uniref:TetR/AcrR family transcriptional regulator n=1 Tax=Williamsia sp. TaxID=1872085 RepID=UPI001A1E65A8|nr:TetR/AcrR family transcriptional regulator [Williamsia sp.]MBJ7291134.1 TetR/AcrR family transcriptional regulator [Williamsia sp.]